MRTAPRKALPFELARQICAYFETRLQPRLARPELNLLRLRRLLRWFADDGARCWHEILPARWARYHEARRASGTGAEQRRKELQELVNFMRWCEKQEPDGPRRAHLFAGEAPSVPVKPPRALDPDQERKLLLAAAMIHDDGWTLVDEDGKASWVRNWPPGAFHCLCLLGLRLGLRPGELQYLAWAELQIEHAVPHVRLRDLVARNSRPIRRLKNALAATPLALPAECVTALLDLRELQRRQGLQRQCVFAIASERKACGWEPANYDHIWRALRARLGLPWLNGYTLRHTFATRLIERDPPMDPHFRRRLMRHVYDATAERYYIQRVSGDAPLDVATGRTMTA